MGKTKILLTGATGYIGGSVLSRLLAQPSFPELDVTVVVRSADKAEKLKKLGLNVIIGSHSDKYLMEKLSAQTDVVLAMADADSLDALKATLSGIKKRFAKTGKPVSYIETSGTGVLVDHAVGDFKSDVIYDDMNPEQIESLSPDQPHRDVDLELLKADQEGYVRAYFILPGTIWGIANGILVDQGIQNPYSQQVPALIKVALDRGRAGMVGQGINIWPNVEIGEVADLYLLLLDHVLEKPEETPHGREGFFFGESDEHSFYEVGKAIGEALVVLGKSDRSEPSTFGEEEIEKYLNGSTMGFGTNCRCKANRSRLIGWKPVKTKADFLKSILPEVEALMKR